MRNGGAGMIPVGLVVTARKDTISYRMNHYFAKSLLDLHVTTAIGISLFGMALSAPHSSAADKPPPQSAHKTKEAKSVDETVTQLLERANVHAKSYVNCEAALQEAEEVIKLRPKNVEAFYIKARCLEFLQGVKPAIETLERAVKINSKSVLCLQQLGSLYDSNKEYEKAIDCYSRALAVNPKQLDSLHMRSMAYGTLKKYDLAIADMDRFIELAPKRSRGYEWRASAHEQAGNWEKAIEDLKKAMSLAPEHKLEFLAHRADLHARFKKYKQAEADYSVLLKANSLDDSFWLKRGDCRMALGDYNGAVKDYTETIDLNGASTAYFSRSKAYEKLGQRGLAERDRTEGKRLLKKKLVEPI